MVKNKKITIPLCEEENKDDEKLKEVLMLLKTDSEISKLSETFKILGDPTRLKIISSLLLKELCVCELSGLLKISVSAISHQLRLLRSVRLVKHRRNGKMIYYSLDDKHIENIINEGQRHIEEV